MTILALIGLINGLLSIGLGFFVFLKNSKAAINRIYFIFDAAIALFNFGYFFWQMTDNSVDALFWFKILVVGLIFINVTFFHVSMAILDKLNEKKRIITVMYLINVVFVVLNMKSMLYTGLVEKYNLGYWPNPTPLFFVYLIFWAVQAIYGSYLLYQGFLKSSGHKKEQIRYFLTGCVIGFVGGSTNWPLWFNINLPPYLNILIAVHVPLTAYAIVKHQLLNIEVAIKRTIVFALLFMSVFGCFIGITIISQQVFGGGKIIGLAVTSFLIILFLRPLEILLVRLSDRYLFQKRYDYRELLKAFTADVLTIVDLDMLVNMTVEKLSEIIRPQTCAVLLYDKEKGEYYLKASNGIGVTKIIFRKDHPVSACLNSLGDIVIFKNDLGKIRNSNVLADVFKILSADILFMLMVHDQIIGVLSLGKKKSDEDYTDEDIDILASLARTEAIAIANARLFDELGKTQAEAAQKEKMAAIGTLSAGINHEICNPLGIIVAQNEAIILNYQRGRYKDVSYESLFKQAIEIMKKNVEQAMRATVITTRLSNFAKPSKELRLEAVGVEKSLDETLSLLSHDLSLNHVEFIKEIPVGFPKIYADSRQVGEILFNIIRNAVQAMNKPNGRIIVNAVANDQKVVLSINDNGCGISEEGLSKLFNPFYTTKGPDKGTGLGLYIVRQVVERNNGKISVQSKLGEGTTFILEFQVYKE